MHTGIVGTSFALMLPATEYRKNKTKLDELEVTLTNLDLIQDSFVFLKFKDGTKFAVDNASGITTFTFPSGENFNVPLSGPYIDRTISWNSKIE